MNLKDVLDRVVGRRRVTRRDMVDVPAREVIAPQADMDPVARVQALLQEGLRCRAAADLDGARDFFAQAAALDSTGAVPEFYLGNCAWELREFDRACLHFQRAKERNPADSRIRLNLSRAELSRGNVASALLELDQLLENDPDNSAAHASLLFDQHFSDRIAPEEIAATHRQFGERLQAQLATDIEPLPPIRNPDPARRLKVGYVSGDFRSHSVSYFMEGILERHRRDEVEVFCYATVSLEDEVTKRLQGLGDHWRRIEGLSDTDAVRDIRADGIDILVDLCGYTWGARPGIFVRRGAPIQMTYLGYPDTSGLAAMDYRIVDHQTDPPGLAQPLHSERLLYLPATQWCFRPDPRLPEPGPLPLLDRGFLEFGSLNDISKVSDTILHCWGRILAELPSARLRLRRTPEGYGRDRVTSLLGGHGIESGRISFSDWFGQVVPGQQYADIDVALDSFPFNGVTTTCESLWMGLPVVTWMGQHSIARSGSSILKALGLPELIAHDADSYVRAAVALGRNPEHLVALRGSLRERMRQSALMDEDTFVKALEGLYRSTWTERVKEDADRSRLAETR